MNSPYAYDASMPSPPDVGSPDFEDWKKLQRQKLVADAMTAQLAQPQGAQQTPMRAPGSALGALQPMADAYVNAMLKQRMQQQGAGMFAGSGSPGLPSGLDVAGGPAYG